MANRRTNTIRKVHRLLGIISAFNLLLLITTGLLLQHMNALRLDESMVSRRWLPANYRPQDGSEGVRADIVITDLHSGRIVGRVGTAVLDVLTLGWLILLATGLVMYTVRANGFGNGRRGSPNSRAKSSSRLMVEETGPNEEKRESAYDGEAQSSAGFERRPAGIWHCCPALCLPTAYNRAVLHLTDTELKEALQALGYLWTKPSGSATPQKTTLVVCAYRCPNGHCHLLCHSPADLCRTEQSALLLLKVMAEQSRKPGDHINGIATNPKLEGMFGSVA